VGLIVDSPWLPGYAGIDTRDYFLFPEKWLEISLGLLERFPDVAWIPGFWVEYGMAGGRRRGQGQDGASRGADGQRAAVGPRRARDA
jgi:hypothetical protein